MPPAVTSDPELPKDVWFGSTPSKWRFFHSRSPLLGYRLLSHFELHDTASCSRCLSDSWAAAKGCPNPRVQLSRLEPLRQFRIATVYWTIHAEALQYYKLSQLVDRFSTKQQLWQLCWPHPKVLCSPMWGCYARTPGAWSPPPWSWSAGSGWLSVPWTAGFSTFLIIRKLTSSLRWT